MGDDENRNELLREFYSVLATDAYAREDVGQNVHKNVEYIPQPQYDDMAHVYKIDDNVIISYKGTDNLSDLRADLMFAVNLHKYDPKFQRAINLFEQMRDQYPDSQITTTGHSLGSLLSSHVSKNQKNTHSYGFNPAAFMIDTSSDKSTYWVSGDDPISMMTQYQQYGKYIYHNPENQTRYTIPFVNLQRRHGMTNFLPESFGGLNEDINIDLENTDFLKLLDSEKGRLPDIYRDNSTVNMPSIDPTLPSLLTEIKEVQKEMKPVKKKEIVKNYSLYRTPIEPSEPLKMTPELSLFEIYRLYPNIPRDKLNKAFYESDKNGNLKLDTEEYKQFIKLI